MKKPTIGKSTIDDLQLYALECIQKEYSNVTMNEVKELWDIGMEKNELIANKLKDMETISFANKEIHKGRAYKKAVGIIKNSKVPIVSGGQAKKFPGIGIKIAKKIDEILNTGELRQAAAAQTERMKVIKLFTSVMGIGYKTANSLYDQGYRTLDDLRRAPLDRQQIIGLKYHSLLLKKIPRSYVNSFDMKLKEIFVEYSNLYNIPTYFEIVGSFARGAKMVGDIDILIPYNTKEEINVLYLIVLDLVEEGLIVDTIKSASIPEDSETMYSGILRLTQNGKTVYTKLDIWFVQKDTMLFQRFGRTATAGFNTRIRNLASKEGYLLSQHGLFKNGKKINIVNEHEIFDMLKIKYIPLNERIDTAEFKKK